LIRYRDGDPLALWKYEAWRSQGDKPADIAMQVSYLIHSICHFDVDSTSHLTSIAFQSWICLAHS
jgi:hypothetical protein